MDNSRLGWKSAVGRLVGVSVSIALAVLASSAQAAVQISKKEYEEAKARAAAVYKSERARCDSLAGKAKDLCVVEARAHRMHSEAGAMAAYKNTRAARYEQQLRNGYADYLVSKQRCGGLGGNDKDVCLKQAKAALSEAIADANAERTAAGAQNSAQQEMRDARKDAR
ncbi:MAG TPA: hypothetical protein VML56_15255 [Burkholderiales bacterium]|nr:hypothetical protein [Burkholderiales bacterium]